MSTTSSQFSEVGSITVSSTENLLADTDFMNNLRSQMLKFAVLQLGEFSLAEDAVQDAWLGAMKNLNAFSGRAAFKTWVFAILKNKIIDLLRGKIRRSKTFVLENSWREEDAFESNGHWKLDERPSSWGDPVKNIDNEAFWQSFEACLEKLPPKQARVFMMREFVGLSSKEICETCEISTSNLHVLLYRARMQLRKCLDHNWFNR